VKTREIYTSKIENNKISHTNGNDGSLFFSFPFTIASFYEANFPSKFYHMY
jgi:hypothetical protein